MGCEQDVVLIERGVKPERAIPIIRSLPGFRDLRVVCETSAELSAIGGLGVDGSAIDIHVPLSGAIDGELYEEACALLSEWRAEDQLLDVERSTAYRGVSLWNLSQLYLENKLFHLLKLLRKLRGDLPQGPHGTIYVLTNRRALLGAVEVLGAQGGCTPDVLSLIHI